MTFASSCGNKLRAKKACAGLVTVFIYSNMFREDLKQYGNSATHYFYTPTSDTLEITKAALKVLQEIYRKGIYYEKSGVIVSDICDNSAIQQNLFDDISNRKERNELMKAIDMLNHRYGPKTIRLSAEGEDKQSWKVKCENKSPNYLTDINEVLTIRI